MTFLKSRLAAITVTGLMAVSFAGAASAEEKKPQKVATAKTCIGEVDVIQYSPAKNYHRFTVNLTTEKGKPRAYYLKHFQKKPVKPKKRLELTNKKRGLKLVQKGDHKFILKHTNLPECLIEIVDYHVPVPKTAYNGIGLLAGVIVEATNNGYGPLTAKQEEEESDWFGGFDFWVDEVYEIAEVIGGNNNPWESGGTGDGGDDNDDDGDDNNDGGDGDDDGGSSWWDWLWECDPCL